MSRASLTKQLDTEWSRFIRLKFADELGRVDCATCTLNRAQDWRSMQCGHFVSRRHYVHRWELTNCAPQCTSCNRFDQGRQWALGQWIDQVHGAGSAAKLWATRINSAPPSERADELRELLDHITAYNRQKMQRVATALVRHTKQQQTP